VRNNACGKQVDVSKDGSACHFLVIPTNEELMIAQETVEIVFCCFKASKGRNFCAS
jgi:acetate kinase